MNWQDMSDQVVADSLARCLGGNWQAWRSSKAPFERGFALFAEGKDGRLVMSGLLVLDAAITTDRLKVVPVRALENEANAERSSRRDDLAPLIRDGRTAEEFAHLVADHYRAWAATTPHPVAAMAAAAGAKPPTVHSWVREARLRGFLPPAHRTKSQPGGWNQ